MFFFSPLYTIVYEREISTVLFFVRCTRLLNAHGYSVQPYVYAYIYIYSLTRQVASEVRNKREREREREREKNEGDNDEEGECGPSLRVKRIIQPLFSPLSQH